MQYHEQQKLRWSRKGLDVAWPSRDLIRDGTFYARWCALEEDDLKEFYNRLEFLIDRLESVGFLSRLVETELAEQRKEMEAAYRPGTGPLTDGAGDIFHGAEDAPTVRYAFEAYLLLTGSFLEYMSRALGFLVKQRQVRSIESLINALDNSSDPSARRLRDILIQFRPTWYELQSDGVRERFANVRMSSPTTDKKKLRDIVAHYRTARLNSFQLAVRRDGTVPDDQILEPGAWAHEYSGAPAIFGEGKGIAPVCRELTSQLAQLTEALLGVLRDQSASVGRTAD
jgi:hypothetical protein